MRRQVSLGLVLVCCLAFLLCTSTASGQAVYGSIIGTVTDPQGNAVAGAKVTVTSITKNTTEETTTNDSGNFSVIHLIPDTYKVKIEATGFKSFDVASVGVQVDTTVRVDGQLQVGAVTQSVEVTGEVPQLKTDRADVSLDFSSDYVEKLPLVNRNFQSLLLSAPGTQQIGWSHAATENPQGSQQTFVQGQHFSGTGYELDGTDNQDPILGIIIINPNLDSVEEAKITLMNYDAEFGKSIAGLVVASTKSGTNDIHGSAFWFRNSDATQARNPFGPTRLPSSKWNQFGGSVGGAIIKNKLFYFGDYQGTRQANGFSQPITIPTAKVLSTCTAATGNCDLSEYLGAVSGGGQVYDPATGNANTGAGRTTFGGNLIPVGRLSPVAVALLKRFPQPTAGGITNNFIVAGSGPFHGNAFDARGDYQAPGNLHIFGRYTRAFYSITGQPGLGIGLGGLGGGIGGLSGSSNIHNHSLAAGFDKAISTTLLTDFRFGWFQYNPHSIKPDANVAAAQALGLNGLNTSDPNTGGLPDFRFDGMTLNNFGDGLDPSRCNCPLIEKEHQYQFVNNWTKISGNHAMKLGVDLRFAYNLRIPSDNNRTGQLSFNHLQTSSGGATGQIGGLDLASFLLGDVSFFDRFVGASESASERQNRYFLYVQDNFRMTSKLTFTYGIRWEDYTPESVNAKGNGGFANLSQGVIRVGGFGPYGLNGGINSYLGGFGPRIGIAYQLRPKTVVRIGYGRSFDIGVFGSNFGHAVTQNLPVLVHQTLNAHDLNPLNVNDVVPVYQMDSATGPPAATFPSPSADGTIPLRGPLNNVDPRIRPTTQRVAAVDMWNATVEHQLTSTMTVEVAYLGNKGTHGFAGNGPTYNVNQRSMVGYGVIAPDARRPFFNKFSYPGFIDPATGTTLMCCSTDLGNYFGMDASSNYNALQFKVEKRISQGLQFVSHYTFSRARYYDGNYFGVDPKIAYGPMNVNRNHVWVSNILYELPFGKGKKYMADANTLTDYVIGGWRLTSITNWSGGLPWTPSYSNCSQDEDVGVCRPNRASGSFPLGVKRDSGGFLTWFTPIPTMGVGGSGGAFSRPSAGTLGNIGMDSFRGPHLFTSNLSLAKNFRITERYRAEFRMDANNIFNHPVMGFNYTQGNTCIDCGGDAGRITNIENNTSMRLLTFGLRFSF
ncbi:MAG TPA: TonB-dependent receptor [Candidatus Acidoferrum sp.]|nr:TonB-dependent receptor [Candidatus Acidoferrum sp.]